MTNWLLDDLWFERMMPWFPPMPAPMAAVRGNSSLNSFIDYMYPLVDRISPTSTGESTLDYYQFYSNRASRSRSALIPSNSQNKSFNRRYKVLNCIGSGGFGQVHDARRRSDNSAVVAKFLPRDRILNWGLHQGKRIPYEIEILWRLRGVAGFIQIFEHFEEPDRFIFTMEKVPDSTTLFEFVMSNSPLPNTELLRHLFRELVSLNLTLKLFGIWHRDCKPENILYCRRDRTLRFIDFGSAAPVQSDDFREFQGTLEIMVPEWILQKRYDGERACVWALGVCLYFLLFQEYPFRSKTDIVNGRSRLSHQESTDTDAYQTIRQCLHGNEYRRPKLLTLLELSWLN